MSDPSSGERLIRELAAELEAVASAWLAAGAQRVELCSASGERLRGWPEPSPAAEASEHLASAIGSAELRVFGLGTTEARPAHQARIEADTALLERLLKVEDELESSIEWLSDRSDELAAFEDLAQSLRGATSQSEALAALARDAVRLSDAAVSFAFAGGNSSWRLVHREPGDCAPSDAELEALVLRSWAGLEHSEGPLLIAAEDLPPLPPGVRSVALAPIRSGGGKMKACLGLLLRAPADKGSPTLRLVGAVVEQAEAAIEMLNRAKLQREMEIASQIQHRLLPTRSPTSEGVEITGRARPAEEVGGDFYDLLDLSTLPDRPLAFFVGDITGKGLLAALNTLVTHTALRAHVRASKAKSPAAILARANVDLYDYLNAGGKFVTIFLGLYDPESKRLRFVNAGHSPVIYRPAGGPARLLPADGPPIGILPELLSRDAAVRLEGDDLLVVGTDGFSEAENDDGELYGYDRLLALVDRLSDRPAEAIADGMIAAVEAFAGDRPQADDMALVVLKGDRMASLAPIHTLDPVASAAAESPALREERWSLPADPAQLAEAGRRIQRFVAELPELEDPARLAQEIELAVQELCTNIIRHAYAGGGGEAQIELRLALLPSPPRLVVESLDRGASFDPSTLSTKPPDPSALPESGMGLYLIRRLTDQTSYAHGKAGNRWRLEWQLDSVPQTLEG